MNIPRPIDAELVSLLHEITDDPAKLLSSFTNRLRRTKHELPQSLALDQDDFFNQSERRMLRRHREEIGDLLYEKCLLFMQETPTEESRIDWNYKGIGEKEISRRQTQELSSLNEHEWEDLSEIGFGLRVSIDSRNVVHVCELALRLRPSFWAKSLLVMALKEDKQFHGALRLLASFDQHITSGAQRSIVVGNEAFVQSALGELELSRQLTKDSFVADDSRVSQNLSWVALELCCGDKVGIVESSRILQESRNLNEAAFGEKQFNEYQRSLRKSDADYRAFMHENQIRLITSLIDKLSGRARKLANAVVQED